MQKSRFSKGTTHFWELVATESGVWTRDETPPQEAEEFERIDSKLGHSWSPNFSDLRRRVDLPTDDTVHANQAYGASR